MRASFAPVAALVAALVLSACTAEERPEIETATVRAGEVVQTVSAPAQIDAVAQATVSAPLGGQVDELLVADGDVVAAGDPVIRLASDTVTGQVEQAEAAVAAAEALGAASASAAPDLSPLLEAFRGQLDTLFPPLLASLGGQLQTTEAALAAAVAGVEQTQQTADEVARGLQDAVDAARAGLPEAGLPEAGLPEAGLPEADLPDVDLPDVDLPDVDLPDVDLPEVDLPEVDLIPPGSVAAEGGALSDALADAQRAAADARDQLTETEQAFEAASRQLLGAEQDLDAQAQNAAAAQAAAIDAQVEQAEFALEAARARIDDLVVVAPIDGVVELSRGGGNGGGGGGLPDGLPSELGDLAGGLGGAADLGGLLAGAEPGGGTVVEGPVSDGSPVGAGQQLLTVFDLSGFTARVEVDEIDVVEVEVGQPVVVRVDAFPGVELEGRVDHVALSPSRDVIGGALYPVTVVITRIPKDVRLRVGLTASAEIEVRRLTEDTVVPTSALLRRGDGEVVHVVRDGRAVEVPVRLLAIGDEDAAIEGDVEPGEEVVTIGVELIEDGDEVRP